MAPSTTVGNPSSSTRWQEKTEGKNQEASIPLLLKTKSVEVSRQVDQSMQFWSGSHCEETLKPPKRGDSQLGDEKMIDGSEPTASTT